VVDEGEGEACVSRENVGQISAVVGYGD